MKVKSLSHVRLFETPWTAARQASLSITSSRSLLKLMSIKSVMPSYHLILCRPLLLLPEILHFLSHNKHLPGPPCPISLPLLTSLFRLPSPRFRQAALAEVRMVPTLPDLRGTPLCLWVSSVGGVLSPGDGLCWGSGTKSSACPCFLTPSPPTTSIQPLRRGPQDWVWNVFSDPTLPFDDFIRHVAFATTC